MVFVDFSNPYLRDYLVSTYFNDRRHYLAEVQAMIPSWLAYSAGQEIGLCAATGCLPRRPAVVLDVDEVLLSNIYTNRYQAPAGVQGPDPVEFHACDYFTGPDGRPWPREELRLGPALPGAAELVRDLRACGLAIFLVTGRLEAIRDETVENLERVGLAGEGAAWSLEELSSPDGPLMMCPAELLPGESIRPFKEGCRRRISDGYRIVANIGDQVSDLGLYGDVQVLLPHPFYHTP